MVALSELLGDLVTDVGGLFLFTPSSSHYEQFAKTDVPTVIIAPENTVETETFVELPLRFQNIKDHIRFGVEDAIEQSIIEADDTIAYNVSIFGGDPDSLVRVRVEENMRSSIYDLFANPQTDPGVIHDVFEVAVELDKKGQKGEFVGALFIVGNTGKVMNKSRPLSYNPFEESHVYVGDPIVDVMLKELSRLGSAFAISDSGKIVSVCRYLELSAGGIDIPRGLDTRHTVGGVITRNTNATAIVLSGPDGLVRAFKGGKMIFGIDPETY